MWSFFFVIEEFLASVRFRANRCLGGQAGNWGPLKVHDDGGECGREKRERWENHGKQVYLCAGKVARDLHLNIDLHAGCAGYDCV